MAGDGPGGGDILNAPNDRWKTKRKDGSYIDTSPQRVDFGQRTSSTSADGQANIDSGGPNPNQASSNDQISNINTDLTFSNPGKIGTIFSYAQDDFGYYVTVTEPGEQPKPYGTKKYYRTAEEAEKRAEGYANSTGATYTAPVDQGKGSTSDQGRRFIAVPYTGKYQKTSNDHVIKDRENPSYKSSVYPNKESAEKAANSMEKTPSAYPKASGTDKVNDAPDSSVQSAANKRPEGPLKDVINKAKDELSSSGKEDYEQYKKNLRKKDNSSTDFTRLLKNAGLLKEFY